MNWNGNKGQYNELKLEKGQHDDSAFQSIPSNDFFNF